MSGYLWKIGFFPVLLLSIVSTVTSQYSYSWQGRSRSPWEDVSPYFNYQSQRVGPQTSSGEAPYEQLISIPAPPVVSPAFVKHTNRYPYPFMPDFGDSEPSYVPGREERRGEVGIRGEVDVSRERMGGFGGTGDVLGYGAYEYKSNDDSLYATPFTDIMRLPKSKSTFIDRFLNDHPLQNL